MEYILVKILAMDPGGTDLERFPLQNVEYAIFSAKQFVSADNLQINTTGAALVDKGEYKPDGPFKAHGPLLANNLVFIPSGDGTPDEVNFDLYMNDIERPTKFTGEIVPGPHVYDE